MWRWLFSRAIFCYGTFLIYSQFIYWLFASPLSQTNQCHVLAPQSHISGCWQQLLWWNKPSFLVHAAV